MEASLQKGSPCIIVVTGRGRDKPGVAESLLKVCVAHDCVMLDIAQFLLEENLVFTFVLEILENVSVQFMKELSASAKTLELQLEFNFPNGAALRESNDSVAVVSVVTGGAITPNLLHGLDEVFSKHGCVVQEIEHRSDNKKEHNGEFSKLQFKINCPPKLLLSNLYMGAPIGENISTKGLQQVAEMHGAHICVRWYDAMNRPNGKSLVVLELSYVLCPYNVLDEVLKEAGEDPNSVEQGERLWQQNQRKVSLLKGKTTDIVEKVINRLEYTKGAKLFVESLKAMGFRLAVLTNSGLGELSKHVKKHFGLDYMICQDLEVIDGKFTGAYVSNEVSDIRFSKSDLMKLLADKEGVEPRNVIMVGDFLKGLSPSNARRLLETFGPNVQFNAQQADGLAVALYLLGFSGRHVGDLYQRFEPESAGSHRQMWAEPVARSPVRNNGARYLVQVSSAKREPGQMACIFMPLIAEPTKVKVSTVRQCSLQDGGMCLGLDLTMEGEDAEKSAKDLFFALQSAGFTLQWEEQPHSNDKTALTCWQHYFQNRHVLTLVQNPQISSKTLQAVLAKFAENNVNVVRMERLSVKSLAAISFVVNLPNDLDVATFTSSVRMVADSQGADLAVQQDNVDRWMRRLVVFDMDSTLIQQEVIDELARIAGVESKVKEITEAAMRGELDFLESLTSRAALLKGHNAEKLFEEVKKNLIYTPGAKVLCDTLKKHGYKMAVISGGFLPVAQEVQRHLGLDYAFANMLEVDERTGLLTGTTTGPVVTPQRKRALLAMIANVEGCQVSQTVAVGDGANDIPMLSTAGLGVAFCAKPKVQEVAEFRINQKDLSSVLYLIGVSEHAMDKSSQIDAT